jgi:hypothetical protein
LITDFLDRLSVRYLIASGKKKKPAAKPWKKRSETSRLESPWGAIADESVTMLEDHHSSPPPVALLLGRPSSCGVYFVLE